MMGKITATRLTARRIDALKPEATVYRVPDAGAPAPGLMVVVYPSGRRAWLSRLTIRRPGHKGQRIDMQQGPWPLVDIDAVRDKHAKAAAKALQGYDPRRLVDADKAVPLFGELMRDWLAHLERLGKLAPATIADHRRRWQIYLADLDGLRVADLTRQHIAPEITRAARTSPTRARASLSTLKAALQWAFAQGWVEENVAATMRAADYGGSAGKRRKTTLTLEELREVWMAADSLTPSMGAAIRLLILTGARRAEVAGMTIEELDLDAGEWRLPVERTKTGTARTVYLPAQAVVILRSQIGQRTQGAALVGRQGTALHPDSLTTAIKRLQRQPGKRAKGGPLAALGKHKPFSVHDLRRSAATLWGDALSAAPHVIDAALGHQAANSVTATYQRQQYAHEQRDLMRRWDALTLDHVTITPGDTVTPFRRSLSGLEVVA
ncbi:tyrosine-type recombinase/integrase (plasmid) [Halomonas sediminis]